ncbi:hypothetical protein GCM10025786_24180 [Nocardioides caeni]
MDQQNAMRVRVSGKSGTSTPRKAASAVTPVRVSGSSVRKSATPVPPVRLRQKKS